MFFAGDFFFNDHQKLLKLCWLFETSLLRVYCVVKYVKTNKFFLKMTGNFLHSPPFLVICIHNQYLYGIKNYLKNLNYTFLVYTSRQEILFTVSISLSLLLAFACCLKLIHHTKYIFSFISLFSLFYNGQLPFESF